MEEQAAILESIIEQYASTLGEETAEALAEQSEEILEAFTSWCDDWSIEGLRTHLGSEIARHICDIDGIYELDDERVAAVLDIIDDFHQQID